MKIRHKQSGIETNLSLHIWVKDYLRKGIYDKWDVTDFYGVVKLLRIREDGTVSKSIIDRKVVEDLILKEPNRFSFEKGVSNEDYENYLKIIFKARNQSSSSLLNKTKYVIGKVIIQPIKILNPLWKSIVAIIVMVIGGFLTHLLIEYYKNS
jgi:hypothetical protein